MSLQNENDPVFTSEGYSELKKDDAPYKKEPVYSEPLDDELGCDDEAITRVMVCLIVIILGVGSMGASIILSMFLLNLNF